jgi:transposase-like protein
MDEVFIRIRGKQHYLWRAVDQEGVVLDILVQSRRSATAPKRFFRKLLKALQYVPRVILTNKLRSYAAAKRESCLGWSTGRAGTPTTGPKCRASRQDDESGRCSGSSHPARRSAFSQPTAGFTTTSSFAAIG